MFIPKPFFFKIVDCGCNLWFKIDNTFGCYIDPAEPPPKGYKCNCKYFLSCFGDPEPCNESELDDPACSGCFTEECCTESGPLGNCNGYNICKTQFCNERWCIMDQCNFDIPG